MPSGATQRAPIHRYEAQAGGAEVGLGCAGDPCEDGESTIAIWGLVLVLVSDVRVQPVGIAVHRAGHRAGPGREPSSRRLLRFCDGGSMPRNRWSASTGWSRVPRSWPSTSRPPRTSTSALGRARVDGDRDDGLAVDQVLAQHAQLPRCDRTDVRGGRRRRQVRKVPRDRRRPSRSALRAPSTRPSTSRRGEHHGIAGPAYPGRISEGIERFTASATPAVFILGLLLVVAFTSVMRRIPPRAGRQRRADAARLPYDRLTQLPNRVMLGDSLEEALIAGRRLGIRDRLPAHRPGPFQGRERHAGPHLRRPALEDGRRPVGNGAARRRSPRAARRRRVRRAASPSEWPRRRRSRWPRESRKRCRYRSSSKGST